MKQEVYDVFSVMFLLNPKNWFCMPFGQCIVQIVGCDVQIHYIQIIMIRLQLAVNITEPAIEQRNDFPKPEPIEDVVTIPCTHCGKDPFPLKSFCNSCGKQDPFKFE